MVKEVDNLADKEENKLERMEIRFKRVEVFLNYLQEEEQAEIKDRGLGKYSTLSSNSKCNTAGPDGLRCCHANEIL